MRSGTPLAQLVLFASGFPDANVVWTLLSSGGTQLATGTITPQVGDVSATIQVTGLQNTLATGELYDIRDLTWTYQVGGQTVHDEIRFVLEGRIPFGARPDGVRNKLGLSAVDLSDDEIELMRAYLWFENNLGSDLLTPFLTGSIADRLKIADGIEALAGLNLLPSLQVRAAKSESSGTNTYERMDIDWSQVEARLYRYVGDAEKLVDTQVDLNSDSSSLFQLTLPTDPLTGA